MSTSRLDILQRNLERSFRRYHADAQIRRALVAFTGLYATQLAESGTRDWTVKGLLSLAGTVAVVVLRARFKTVSQSLVMEHVQVQQAVEAQQAPDVPAKPAPASEQVYTPVTAPATVDAPNVGVVSEHGPEITFGSAGNIIATPKPGGKTTPPTAEQTCTPVTQSPTETAQPPNERQDPAPAP